MKSTLGKLGSADFWKGLLIAVITPVLILLQQIIPSWTEWLATALGSMSAALIVQAAASAFVAYLIKNLGTDDTKQAVKLIQKQGGIVKDETGKTVPTIVKKSVGPDI